MDVNRNLYMSYYYTISKKGETSGNLYKVFLRKKAICNFSDCCIHRIHFHSMGEQSLISNPTPNQLHLFWGKSEGQPHILSWTSPSTAAVRALWHEAILSTLEMRALPTCPPAVPGMYGPCDAQGFILIDYSLNLICFQIDGDDIKKGRDSLSC